MVEVGVVAVAEVDADHNEIVTHTLLLGPVVEYEPECSVQKYWLLDLRDYQES